MIEHYRYIIAWFQKYIVIRETCINMLAGPNPGDSQVTGRIESGNISPVSTLLPGNMEINMVGGEGVAWRIEIPQWNDIGYTVNVQRGGGKNWLRTTITGFCRGGFFR